MAGETIKKVENSTSAVTVLETSNGYFYPVTIPDHDVPFPLVDLIYRARDDLSAIKSQRLED